MTNIKMTKEMIGKTDRMIDLLMGVIEDKDTRVVCSDINGVRYALMFLESDDDEGFEERPILMITDNDVTFSTESDYYYSVTSESEGTDVLMDKSTLINFMNEWEIEIALEIDSNKEFKLTKKIYGVEY